MMFKVSSLICRRVSFIIFVCRMRSLSDWVSLCSLINVEIFDKNIDSAVNVKNASNRIVRNIDMSPKDFVVLCLCNTVFSKMFNIKH